MILKLCKIWGEKKEIWELSVHRAPFPSLSANEESATNKPHLLPSAHP